MPEKEKRIPASLGLPRAITSHERALENLRKHRDPEMVEAWGSSDTDEVARIERKKAANNRMERS